MLINHSSRNVHLVAVLALLSLKSLSIHLLVHYTSAILSEWEFYPLYSSLKILHWDEQVLFFEMQLVVHFKVAKIAFVLVLTQSDR